MKKLEVKFSADGLMVQNVSFVVMQLGKVVVQDTISGKISAQYRRTYEVDADESHLDLLLCNVQDPSLTVNVSLI